MNESQKFEMQVGGRWTGIAFYLNRKWTSNAEAVGFYLPPES